ncbi:30S ribosomal protein S20 [bacterium]|nr:30S ribosomal protein S20 [bacterium]
MPIIKSAIKRTRQAKKRRAYNVGVKQAVKGKIKAFRADLSAEEIKKAHDSLVAAISELDRAVKRGTLHKRTVARRKSRLTKQYNTVSDAAYGTQKSAKPAAKPAATKKPAAKKAAK